MKKVLGIISLLLSTTLATANSIDFDKAFKESAKIEKQIKKTSFPKQYLPVFHRRWRTAGKPQ